MYILSQNWKNLARCAVVVCMVFLLGSQFLIQCSTHFSLISTYAYDESSSYVPKYCAIIVRKDRVCQKRCEALPSTFFDRQGPF